MSNILSYTALNIKELRNVVLILDGLDEICTVKGLNIELLCENLIASTYALNNVKIIITTRLNYINIAHVDNRNVINIMLLGMDRQDQSDWIDKYFTAKSSSSPSNLKKYAIDNVDYLSKQCNKNLSDLLSIPLIFYMISSTGIKINQLKNIGELYERVFIELFSRTYNESTSSRQQKHEVYKEISIENARKIAQCVAYEMYITNKTLLPLSNARIQEIIKEIAEEDSQSRNKRKIEKLFLLTFFYKDNDDIVEFAHKSIMEFFAAEFILYELLNTQDSVLKKIFNLLIKKPISVEVFTFLKYKVGSIEKGKYKLLYEEFLEKYTLELTEYIKFNLSEQLGYFSISNFDDYLSMLRMLIHLNDEVFHLGLNVSLLENHLIRTMIKSSLIEHVSNNNILLKRKVIPFGLSYIEFKGEDFAGLSFAESVFTNLVIDSSNFDRSLFSESTIKDCIFENSKFVNTVIMESSFTRCKFDKSHLELNIGSNTYFSDCEFTNLDELIIHYEAGYKDQSSLLNCTFEVDNISDFSKVFHIYNPKVIIRESVELDQYVMKLDSYQAEKIRQERIFGEKKYKIEIREHYLINLIAIGDHLIEKIDYKIIDSPNYILI